MLVDEERVCHLKQLVSVVLRKLGDRNSGGRKIKWMRSLKSWGSPWSNMRQRAEHNTWQWGRQTDDLVQIERTTGTLFLLLLLPPLSRSSCRSGLLNATPSEFSSPAPALFLHSPHSLFLLSLLLMLPPPPLPNGKYCQGTWGSCL